MNTKLTILVKLKPILRLLSIDFSDLENNKIPFFLFRLYPPHASSHNNIGVLLQDTHSEVWYVGSFDFELKTIYFCFKSELNSKFG